MPKYKLSKSIKRSGWPTSSKLYSLAHSEASNAEKKKYPKGYQALKKLDAKTPANRLIGKNSKSGKITVSSVVPKRYRAEVAYHERTEAKALKRLAKGRKKK